MNRSNQAATQSTPVAVAFDSRVPIHAPILDAPKTQLVSLDTMTQRPCSKQACATAAVATLTFDYSSSVAVLGPLSVSQEPHAHDLCREHAKSLTVPQGWQIVRHTSVA